MNTEIKAEQTEQTKGQALHNDLAGNLRTALAAHLLKQGRSRPDVQVGFCSVATLREFLTQSQPQPVQA